MVACPITAYSLVNALGTDNRTVFEALAEGRSGVRMLADPAGHAQAVGRVDTGLEALPAGLRAYDTRQARLAWKGLDGLETAVHRAASRWGSSRIGIVIGTSTGGIATTEAAFGHACRTGTLPADFDLARQHAMDAVLSVIRARIPAEGPAYVISTACSSSAKVFGSAERLMRAGWVDAVVVGGVDSLCRMTALGFESLELLSPTPCRPFSAERGGINLGEGAAFLLLEREADAPTWLLGVGETSDAHHMTAPEPNGAGAVAALEQALRRSGVDRSEVSHVNAHATGTVLNDRAESLALAQVLPGTPIVATKGYTGHLLGAAGATEVAFSCWALERGWLAESVGAKPLDDSLGLAVNLVGRPYTNRVVVSNSFAFGGSNVCVVLGAAPR